MKNELFKVGAIVLTGTTEGDAVTYHAKTNYGLCVSAPTVGELLQQLADAAKKNSALNDPLRVCDGLDEAVDVLSKASDEALAQLHAAYPLTGTQAGITPASMQEVCNSEEGTALLGVVAVPAVLRDQALAKRNMSLTIEGSPKSGERQIVTLHKTGGPDGPCAWVYVMPFIPLVIHFQDCVVEVQACVVASRQWFTDHAMCIECGGKCKGEHDGTSKESLLEKLPPNARVVRPPTSLAGLMNEYQTAAVASFRALPGNPTPPESAAVVAPLLAYLAGIIRFLAKNGIDRLPNSDLACPWYVVGLSLAGQYGLTDSDKIRDFGLVDLDEWDGFATVLEPDGAHMVTSSSPPAGNN